MERRGLFKRFKIIKQAEIDGSNNLPPKNSDRPSNTENDILFYVQEHYREEVAESVAACDEIENKIQKCNALTKANGHKELFADVQRQWSLIKDEFQLNFQKVSRNLQQSIDNLRIFRMSNEIAGREPNIRSRFKLILSIAALIIFASIEIWLNTSILASVTGGGEAIAISMMVSAINIGLSFMVGKMCLTNLFCPVKTSLSKGYYIAFVILFVCVIVYVNLMMGVFRGLGDAATNLVTNKEALEAALRKQLFAAVFPFDDFDSLTFQSIFLMLVGFFFAALSLIDGYFFDDPINGYGVLGRKRQKAQENYDGLVSSAYMLILDFQNKAFEKLGKKYHERKDANSEWGNIMDELQRYDGIFGVFADHSRAVIVDSFRAYQTRNQDFRTTPNPPYFGQEVDTSFIQTFAEEHANIADELSTDEQKLAQMEVNLKIIDEEHADAHRRYTDYFHEQQKLLYELLNDEE